MMKKKMIELTMTMVMVLLYGCGKETPVIKTVNESIEANSITTEDTEDVDETNEDETENEDLTNLVAVKEADESNLNLREYKYSFEDRDAEEGGDAVFYLADFEDDSNSIHLTDSIQIYAFNGICIGHTKEGIDITTIGRYDEWYYLMLDRNYRFLKVADVESVGSDMSENDENHSVAPKETTTAPVQNNNVVDDLPASVVTDSVPDATVEVPAQTNDKYTPEEAVAVWSGILNDNGMTFDSSIKDFASWGTGIIYLNKGMPEEIAQQDLLGYAYGDGGGHSFNRYYYEVTGSDDGAVYITAWCCP